MPINVLYIHPIGAFGGASRSLVELIRGFPDHTVVPYVITQRGSVVEHFRSAGAQVMATAGIAQFDNTRYGHYRGARWLLLLREIFYAPFTLAAILRARRMWPDVDIVHANEVVGLLAIVLARQLLRKPAVVHVRSVQREDCGRLRDRLVEWVLTSCADAVIAIDETVRRSLPRRIECEVVHNAFTPEAGGDEALPVPRQRLKVGMVGNLLALKGVYDFLEVARICRDRGVDAEFVIVGSNPRKLTGLRGLLLKASGFAKDVESDIKRFVSEHGLETRVRMQEFTPDINQVYRTLDVLCFPSHLDAVGRPVFEAAFWKVPSIVAIRAPEPDTMIHGETGLCVKPNDPRALADAVCYFHANPAERKRMGEAAHALAVENFNSRKNAAKVLAIYERVLARCHGR